jgi:hypothetical protein
VQLGARLEYVTENGISGCKVIQSVRGTSVALKLQENDLILKIGDSSFNSIDASSSYVLNKCIFKIDLKSYSLIFCVDIS